MTATNSTRELVKSVARGMATVAVVPSLLSYWVRSGLVGPDRALEGSTQALAMVPGLLGQYLRRAFLSHVLVSCHSSATICFGTLFSQAGARIGENVYIGPNCHLGLVDLERDVLLGPGVQIPSGRHTHDAARVDVPIRDQQQHRTVISIRQGAWIGGAAVVMADVGRDSVVGAGAVVTKPIPDRVVAAGVPARVIRDRAADHPESP